MTFWLLLLTTIPVAYVSRPFVRQIPPLKKRRQEKRLRRITKMEASLGFVPMWGVDELKPIVTTYGYKRQCFGCNREEYSFYFDKSEKFCGQCRLKWRRELGT